MCLCVLCLHVCTHVFVYVCVCAYVCVRVWGVDLEVDSGYLPPLLSILSLWWSLTEPGTHCYSQTGSAVSSPQPTSLLLQCLAIGARDYSQLLCECGDQHQANHAGATSSFPTDVSSHPQELPGMTHKLILAWVHHRNCLKQHALETSCVF